MKKYLVETSNLDQFICQATRKIYVDNTMILTAGAKDKLAELGIPIVYGPRPQNLCCRSAVPGYFGAEGSKAVNEGTELENMLIAIAAVLQKEYKVTDPEELKKLTCQIVTTLRDNI